jgi:hypothetical protein
MLPLANREVKRFVLALAVEDGVSVKQTVAGFLGARAQEGL